MNITVTDADNTKACIALAVKGAVISMCCPVALALNRMTGKQWYVNGTSARTSVDGLAEWYFQEDLRNQITRFDHNWKNGTHNSYAILGTFKLVSPAEVL